MSQIELIKKQMESIRVVTDKLAVLAYAVEDVGNDRVCEKLLAYRSCLYDIHDQVLVSVETIQEQAEERNSLNER